MKTLKLNFLGKTYNLRLVESNYTNNNKTYYWLVDTADDNFFCDITVNLPYSNQDVNWIDNDFMMCFKTAFDCKKWLKQNLKIKEFWLGYTSWFYYFTK